MALASACSTPTRSTSGSPPDGGSVRRGFASPTSAFSSAWAWRTERSPAPSPVAHAVVAVDDNPSDELRADADALGITLGSSDELTDLVTAAAFVVPTPGLPEQHEAFAIADAAGVAVVSEFDLAAVWDDRPIVAVTGTNGKTTRSSSPSPRSQPMVVSPSPPGTPTSRLSRRSTIPTLTSSLSRRQCSTCTRAGSARPSPLG